jgi:hypothetical protein
MSSVSIFKILTGALFVSLAAARKTYLVKDEPLAQYQPTVRASTCSYCIFKNNDDQFCLDYLLNWEIGWETYQENDYTSGITSYADRPEDDFYKARFQIYSKQKGEFHPEMNIPSFFYFETNV